MRALIVVNGYFATSGGWRSAGARRSTADGRPARGQPSREPARYALLTVMIAMAVALWLAYEVPAIGNTGQTLGKRLIGLQRLAVDGTERSAGRAFRRWFVLGPVPSILLRAWGCCSSSSTRLVPL